MPFSLERKIAVITGGGSGIGRAIALRFAKEGAHVCILEFNKDAGTNTVRDIQQTGGLAKAFTCDVSQQDQVNGAVKAIIDEYGRVDILVNCAGVAHIGKLENTSASDFQRIFDVNVKGTFNAMQAVIATMKAQQSGVILNLASVASSVGIPDRFAYSMSKGAVLAMTLSTARDYIDQGIRCNCISPARVHTPFVDGFIKANYPGQEQAMFEKLSKTQPIGRMATPEEVAYLALYLCSDEAGFITGTDYPLDGGFIKLNN